MKSSLNSHSLNQTELHAKTDRAKTQTKTGSFLELTPIYTGFDNACHLSNLFHHPEKCLLLLIMMIQLFLKNILGHSIIRIHYIICESAISGHGIFSIVFLILDLRINITDNTSLMVTIKHDERYSLRCYCCTCIH